jgi:hypothetical protein
MINGDLAGPGFHMDSRNGRLPATCGFNGCDLAHDAMCFGKYQPDFLRPCFRSIDMLPAPVPDADAQVPRRPSFF